MATTVGDLVVTLGIKGADKTVVSITAVSHAIKETASVSLEAKAAIVGAMYALEQFFARSGAAGTALANFNTVTGISTQRLQEYQYAARQMGVSNEETASTFKNLQSAMEKQVLGVSRVSTWSQLSAKLGGTLGVNDVNKFAKDPALLMQKLQQYALLEQDIAKRNETLRGFGVSDDMIAALSKGAFNQDAFSKAPKYSDKEIAALDRANTAWGNLSDKIAMAIGHLNAAHGEKIVKIFSGLVDLGLQFADVLLRIAARTHFFENMEKYLTFIIGRIKEFIKVIKSISSSIGSELGKTDAAKNLSSIFKSFGESVKSIDSIRKSLTALISSTKLFGTEMNAFQLTAQAIDMIFQGWAAIFSGIAATLKAVADYLNPQEEKDKTGRIKAKKEEPGLTEKFGNFARGAFLSMTGLDEYGAKSVNGVPTGANPGQPPKLALVPPPPPLTGNAQVAAPRMPAQVVKQGNKNQVTVNQTLNFQHEGKNAQQTATSIEKAANRAIKTMNVTQVN